MSTQGQPRTVYSQAQKHYWNPPTSPCPALSAGGEAIIVSPKDIDGSDITSQETRGQILTRPRSVQAERVTAANGTSFHSFLTT